MRAPILAVCFALLVSAAAAQPSRTIPGPFVRNTTGGVNGQTAWATAQVVLPPVAPPFIGAPFSGEESQRSTQVLPDGTRINRSMGGGAKVFRDSEGRTRVERTMFPVPPARAGTPEIAQIVIVEINDPGQGVYYLLDSNKKIAHRLKYPPPAPYQTRQPVRRPSGPSTETDTSPQGIRTTTEDLGQRVINGVQAEGRRRTMTIPENLQGNDRPMNIVTEDWTAVSLEIIIKSTNTSPQSGESTFELTNVSLASPSPLLFSPPPDYTVQDEQSPFTAEFGQKPAGARGSVSVGIISVGKP